MKRLMLVMVFPPCLFLYCCKSNDSTLQSEAVETEAASKDVGICLWKELAVKETPSEKGKYMTSVYLGEKFNILPDTASELINGKRHRYLHVKLIDGTQGWVRNDLIASNAVGAAFLKETTIYKRPDAMTPSTKSFRPLDFVAAKTVLENGWVEVMGKREGDTWFTSGWVKDENLTRTEIDVAFAVFYNRAMENKDETKREAEIQSLLANHEFGSSVFLATLTEMIEERDGELMMIHADEEDEIVLDSTASDQ